MLIAPAEGVTPPAEVHACPTVHSAPCTTRYRCLPESPTWTVVLAARRDASGIAALSLRNCRRHRGARRRPPAAAPSDAAGIVACGGRAARALRAPRARPDRGRSSAAALRCRGRCRLGRGTRGETSGGARGWGGQRGHAARARPPP